MDALPVRAAALPPAQPRYVLRAHQSQLHALTFLRQNSRLLTGDADGWVVLWDLASRRAVAVWRAHRAAILGLAEWGAEQIITHGRDGAVKVWAIKPEDEDTAAFSTLLPIHHDDDDDDDDGGGGGAAGAAPRRKEPALLHNIAVNSLTFCSFSSCREPLNVPRPLDEKTPSTPDRPHPIYLAVPAAEDSQVDIHHLPTERSLPTVHAPNVGKPAMVMATRILSHHHRLLLVAGYESGHTCTFALDPDTRSWHQLHAHHTHTQPVLSLDLAPDLRSFFSSSADDVLARHPLCLPGPPPAAAAAASLEPQIVHTRHAGQQSLRVRGDGRILATAGWDSRIRVYAAASLRELAVLKWHREGCYAVSFAALGPAPEGAAGRRGGGGDAAAAAAATAAAAAAAALPGRTTARHRREERSRSGVHWVAAGAKDGKVSLWDIY